MKNFDMQQELLTVILKHAVMQKKKSTGANTYFAKAENQKGRLSSLKTLKMSEQNY